MNLISNHPKPCKSLPVIALYTAVLYVQHMQMLQMLNSDLRMKYEILKNAIEGHYKLNLSFKHQVKVATLK